VASTGTGGGGIKLAWLGAEQEAVEPKWGGREGCQEKELVGCARKPSNQKRKNRINNSRERKQWTGLGGGRIAEQLNGAFPSKKEDGAMVESDNYCCTAHSGRKKLPWKA